MESKRVFFVAHLGNICLPQAGLLFAQRNIGASSSWGKDVMLNNETVGANVMNGQPTPPLTYPPQKIRA